MMGTTRNTRAIQALRPGWLAVDDRSQRRLLAQLVPTASLFNFYDHTAARNGRWSVFYEHLPLPRYAMISEIDLEQTGRFFWACLQKLGEKIDLENVGQTAAAWSMIEMLLSTFRLVDADAKLFSGMPGEAAMAEVLQQAVSMVLAPNYRIVLAWAEWLARTNPPAVGFFRSSRTPGDLLAPPDIYLEGWGSAEPLSAPPDQAPAEFVRQMTQVAWSTRAAAAKILGEARRWFDIRYDNPSGLPPHFALYLAFVRQFAGAQETINRLPSLHCDYFYRKVLGLSPEGPVPDTAFVAFTAAQGGWRELGAGTELLAGKDAAGRPVVYATREPTTVTTSAVARASTLFLTAPGRSGATGFYSALTAASADGAGAPLPPGGSWATFGEDQEPLAGGARTMADAQVGFAIASPVLHLEEGERTVTLEILFANDGVPPPGEPGVDESLTLLATVDYSGARGWAAPSGGMKCTLSYFGQAKGGPVPAGLTVTIGLRVGDPACVNYTPNPKALGPEYDARAPVLRLRFFNPLAWFGGPDGAAAERLTSAFAAATVSRITVGVSAKGLRDLALAGPSGKLVAPGKPVAPFGSPPHAAGRFAIGKVELFRKRLTSLDVTLAWQGLPRDEKGLGGYYADYNSVLGISPPIGNLRYTAGLSALVGRSWVPIETSGNLLFSWPGSSGASPAADGPLDASTSWSADPSRLPAVNPSPDFGLSGPIEYGPATATGFLGLTLGAPEYLFGQQLYAGLVTTIAANNALVLTRAAKASGGESLPVAPSSAGSDYSQLRISVRKLHGVVWSFVFRTAAAKWTFTPRLFAALEKLSALPPPIAAAATAAGANPEAVFTALGGLKGKSFTSPAGFRQVIASTLRLDPAQTADSEVLDLMIPWLASAVRGSPSAPAPAAEPEPPSIQPMPPAPFVPMACEVSVSYGASTTIDLEGGASSAAGWDQVWQLDPFAAYPRPKGRDPLIPAVPVGGFLYLGLGDIQPPETLSLLFVLKAVPASNAPDAGAPAWSWLEGDTWRDAKPEASAVRDGTWGFQRTGIVRIDLPAGADTVHTVMPAGLVWIRARVAHPEQRLRTVQILPHAAEADWQPPAPADGAAAAAHFARPLPAQSIIGLRNPDRAIAKVLQPLAAAGGAPPETQEDFCTRVSERLRHKGRAVAARDYERLLLRQFPSLFSARVVAPATAAEAGTVAVVVLPTVTVPPAAPPPGFTGGDLLAFESALSAVAPQTARIKVVNPVYEPIWVRAQVDFARDRSVAHYRAVLCADLKAFVSPWIYDQASVRDPAQSFHASDFGAFIRGRPYVLQVGTCEVFRGEGPISAGDAPVPLVSIVPSSPRSMLISAAEHQVDPLP